MCELHLINTYNLDCLQRTKIFINRYHKIMSFRNTVSSYKINKETIGYS